MAEIRPSRVETQAPGTVINRYKSGSVEVVTPSPFDRTPESFSAPESSVVLGDDRLPEAAVFEAGDRPDEADLAETEEQVDEGEVDPFPRPAADNTPANTATAQAKKRPAAKKS